ncbi:MAG: hypothetical protein KF730_15545 [Sphingomonas sp.]|uniref:hypothetical protein n=1 Tax=Sphingomonas sp. TaxID=28214 RepID=UPI0025CCEEF1|nr:hypothetical protein [Sphingomonas sp.]MBX3565979.1 hypothetical protein [Sphingomonas sp.]
MPLTLTLAAALLQTAQDPAAAERGCVIEALAPDKRIDLAERFITGEMQAVQAIAQAPAAACAARWKWSDEARDWHIVHNATYAAMVTLEAQLPKPYDGARLEALFGKLSQDDQMGLTLEGGPKLDAARHAALGQRIGAILAAEKLTPEDVNTAGNWFVAYAQFIESDAHLKALAGAK